MEYSFRGMLREKIERLINAAFFKFLAATTGTGVISTNVFAHVADYGRCSRGKAIVIKTQRGSIPLLL